MLWRNIGEVWHDLVRIRFGSYIIQIIRMNHLMVGLLLIVTVMPGVVRLLIFFENIILKNKSGVFV